MSLHVVTCAPDYLPSLGGAEIGLHDLLTRSAASSAHRFSVVVPTTHAGRPATERMDGITVHRFRRPRRWANWYAPTLAGLAGFPTVVRRTSPDLLHLSYALPSGPGAVVAAVATHTPYVLSLGGNDVSDPIHPPPGPLRSLAVAIARRARHVICNTTVVRDAVTARWGVDPGRASVNPFGVDTDILAPLPPDAVGPARRRWSRRPDGRLVVVLGRLERRKGVDVLIEAVGLLGDSAVEVLVAGTGREEPDLHRRVTDLGLQERIRFVGFVPAERKRELLAAADLLVVPSRYEGQGIVIAEAAACGTPALATDAGGTVDMVDHGRTGLLVPASQPAALARGIEEALSDGDRLARWSEEARVRAVSLFDLRRTVSRFLQVVEGAVA